MGIPPFFLFHTSWAHGMSIVSQTVSLSGNPQAGAPYGVAYFDQPSGLTATVTVPAASAQTLQGGRLKRIDPQSGAVLETYALAASESLTMGPFPTNRR